MTNNGSLSRKETEEGRKSRGGVVNKREEAKGEKEEEWMESSIVSASSISSYINVSCTISLITVSPPHWLYPLVQGEGHHSLSSLFIVFLSPTLLSKSLHSFSLFFSAPPLLSFPLSISLSHSLYPPPPCHGIPHPSLLSLFLSWRCVTSCPHETSQFSASSADE